MQCVWERSAIAPRGSKCVVVEQDACSHLRSATRGTPMLMAAAMALLLCLAAAGLTAAATCC